MCWSFWLRCWKLNVTVNPFITSERRTPSYDWKWKHNSKRCISQQVTLVVTAQTAGWCLVLFQAPARHIWWPETAGRCLVLFQAPAHVWWLETAGWCLVLSSSLVRTVCWLRTPADLWFSLCHQYGMCLSYRQWLAGVWLCIALKNTSCLSATDSDWWCTLPILPLSKVGVRYPELLHQNCRESTVNGQENQDLGTNNKQRR